MTTIDDILSGIKELKSVNYAEEFRNNIITLSGSKKSFFGGKDLVLTIQKSNIDTNTALVAFSTNGTKKSLDFPKHILIDILTTTKILDSKLQMKIDLLFGDKKIEFINGQLVIS
jgi:hypothetical protein